MCDHLWRHALSRIGCTRVSDGSDRDILASAFHAAYRQAAALSHRRRFRTDSPLMIFLPEPVRQNRVLVSL
jgi:hypothetical protein